MSAVLLFNQKCRGVFQNVQKSDLFATLLTLFALFLTFFTTFFALFDRFLQSASFLIDANVNISPFPSCPFYLNVTNPPFTPPFFTPKNPPPALPVSFASRVFNH